MTRRSDLGREGEEFAAKYLERRGYRIIARNYRIHNDELDIIGVAPDKTLAFIEVKTMKDLGGDGIRPEDHLTSGKRKKISRAASLYAGGHPELINDERGWRLDLIALNARDGGFAVEHYQNI